MSIIESALERMRRSGVARGNPVGSLSRTAAAKAPPVTPSAGAAPPIVERPFRTISVDAAALRGAGYLPGEQLQRRFAEYFRRIKRPLIERALAADSGMHLILVSSALPGDGKTFTSINLALSMARERDRSVLLVDADIPRAQVSEVFGLREERGLIDALSDETQDVESFVVHTDIPGFELLPAGRSVEDATELLASGRMRRVVDGLAAHDLRRLIVIDSAPLLAASEGRALLPIAEQVVLVVRAGMTPQRAVLDAVALVDKNKLRGLVLNQAPLSSGDGKYGYSGYSSYAGYGSGDDPARVD